MKSNSALYTFFLIISLNCCVVLTQFDYGPPVLDETQTPVDSTEVKCLVCKATLDEMLIQINKIDPKRTVEIGYHLDSGHNKKTVQLSKSETYLTELMENICDKMDDYAKARFKSNGAITLLKLTSPGGAMNPDMGSVDFIQDGDLNKSLKHFCLEILEDNEDALLNLLMRDQIPDDANVQLCTVSAEYCDDLPAQKDYVLEEHEEL